MSSIDIKALRELAQAATGDGLIAWYGVGELNRTLSNENDELRYIDACHIAACEPSTILTLIDRLERAEAVVQAAREVVRLQALPMRVPTATGQMARITEATYGNEKHAAWAALRAALGDAP